MGFVSNDMRSDYMLYVVAAICFIITGLAFALTISPFERNLSAVSSVILGLFFAGLGVTQRPRSISTAVDIPSRSIQPLSAATALMEVQTPPPPSQTAITDTPPSTASTMSQEPTVSVEPILPLVPALQLTDIKGIGPKRMEQLKALGINSIDDLSKASIDDVANKLKISPKITTKWVNGAKDLVQKP